MKSLKSVKSAFKRWLEKPENIYLSLSALGILAFIVITPPFQGPDEEAHYVRVQYLSRGYVLPIDTSQAGAAKLPVSLRDTLKKTFFEDDIRWSTSKKYELSRTFDALNDKPNWETIYNPPMLNNSPVPYIPAGVAVSIVNALGGSMLVGMYAARLALGATAIAITYFAIRLLPRKKYLYLSIALLPMMLFQQSMVSIDGTSYAVLGFFIAYLLHLYQKVTITKKEWLMLVGLSATLTFVKPLIFIFLPLLLILFAKPKAKLYIVICFLAATVSLVGWSLVSSQGSSADQPSLPNGVNAVSQVDYLINNPKKVIRVAWNSYMTDYGDEEMRGVVGVFGYADTVYPMWMYTLFCGLIAVLAVVNVDNNRSKAIATKLRLTAAGLCLMYFAGVNAALYLYYSPVGYAIVYGTQGRYFLPILIVISTFVVGEGLSIKSRDVNRVRRNTILLLALLTALAAFIILQRYYLFTP